MSPRIQILWLNIEPIRALESTLRDRLNASPFEGVRAAHIGFDADGRGQVHVGLNLRSGDQVARFERVCSVADLTSAVDATLHEAAMAVGAQDATADHPSPTGRITQITADRGRAKLETSGGRELSFGRAQVVDGRFDDLRVGDEVYFVETLGTRGGEVCSVHVDDRLLQRSGQGLMWGRRFAPHRAPHPPQPSSMEGADAGPQPDDPSS